MPLYYGDPAVCTYTIGEPAMAAAFLPQYNLLAVTCSEQSWPRTDKAHLIKVFRVNEKTGTLTETAHSPFKTGKKPIDIKFISPTLAEVLCGSKEAILYAVQPESGKFTELKRYPIIAPEAREQTISYLPEHNLYARLDFENNACSDGTIQTCTIDSLTNKIITLNDFPTGMTTSDILSVLPGLNAVMVAGVAEATIDLYDLDEQTGKIKLIDGSPLLSWQTKEAKKQMVEANKIFDEKYLLIKAIQNLIAEYVGAERGFIRTQTLAEIKAREDKVARLGLEALIEQNQKKKQNAPFDMQHIVKILREKDDVQALSPLINAYTINARDEFDNTPLILAATFGRTQCAELLLNAEEEVQESEKVATIAIADVDLYAADQKNALMKAIANNHFAVAFMIAQKMKDLPKGFNFTSTNGESVYTLMEKVSPENIKTPEHTNFVAFLGLKALLKTFQDPEANDQGKRKAATASEAGEPPFKKLKTNNK